MVQNYVSPLVLPDAQQESSQVIAWSGSLSHDDGVALGVCDEGCTDGWTP